MEQDISSLQGNNRESREKIRVIERDVEDMEQRILSVEGNDLCLQKRNVEAILLVPHGHTTWVLWVVRFNHN